MSFIVQIGQKIMSDLVFNPIQSGVDVLTLNGEKVYSPSILETALEFLDQKYIDQMHANHISRHLTDQPINIPTLQQLAASGPGKGSKPEIRTTREGGRVRYNALDVITHYSHSAAQKA